jgi:hypothetical protein
MSLASGPNLKQAHRANGSIKLQTKGLICFFDGLWRNNFSLRKSGKNLPKCAGKVDKDNRGALKTASVINPNSHSLFFFD